MTTALALASCLFCGLSGYWLSLGKTRNARKCGCDHPLAYHNIAEGSCHYSTYDYDTGTRRMECGCQQYTGRMS